VAGRPSSPALLPREKGDTPCPRGGRVGEGGEYRKGEPDYRGMRRRKTLIPGPSPKGEGGYSLPPWGKGWGRG